MPNYHYNVIYILLSCSFALVWAGEKYPYLSRCAENDNDCVKGNWQESLEPLSKGIPEINVQSTDPLKLHDFTVEIPNMLKCKVKNGVMEGFKTCIFNYAKLTRSKGQVNIDIELNCNLTSHGTYEMTAHSSIIPGLAATGDLKGNGSGGTKLVNLVFKESMAFDIIKNDQGETVLSLNLPVKYEYRIDGYLKFLGNNIQMAGQDMTEIVLKAMNDNWKMASDNVVAPFFKEGVNAIANIQKQYFLSVPTSEYAAYDLEA